MIPVKAPLTN
jgi:26S proteasome regulatory subunit N8